MSISKTPKLPSIRLRAELWRIVTGWWKYQNVLATYTHPIWEWSRCRHPSRQEICACQYLAIFVRGVVYPLRCFVRQNPLSEDILLTTTLCLTRARLRGFAFQRLSVRRYLQKVDQFRHKTVVKFNLKIDNASRSRKWEGSLSFLALEDLYAKLKWSIASLSPVDVDPCLFHSAFALHGEMTLSIHVWQSAALSIWAIEIADATERTLLSPVPLRLPGSVDSWTQYRSFVDSAFLSFA